MPNPPRDSDGLVIPHDDRQSISDDDELVRYLDSKQEQVVRNNDGSYRASSSGFSPSSRSFDKYEGMSVDMLKKLKEDGVTLESRMTGNQDCAAVVNAGQLRNLGFKIGSDPLDTNDQYHAEVWGVENKHRKKIRKCSRIIVPPPGN